MGEELLVETPISEYCRELKRSLPAKVFTPTRSRLLWLLLHVAIAIGSIVVIAHGWGGWPLALALSLVIGHSYGCAAFVAHETLHGAVVRNRRARMLIGWLGFLPFTLSPSLWVVWHNRVHHGHTSHMGIDTDTYPTLEQYRSDRLVRVVDHISVGGRRLGGIVTLLFGFTGQGMKLLWCSREAIGFSRAERRAAMFETLLGVVFWCALGFLIGPLHLFVAFGIPLLIANALVLSYILTNHSLSPLTDINDPLLNSLSVRLPRVLEIFHLNFGFHVEHHLFPSMSGRHAPMVRQLLRDKWPRYYQSMRFERALWRLFSTGRVYKNATTLIDPRRGKECATLLPTPDSR